jgi:hypothetical protein
VIYVLAVLYVLPQAGFKPVRPLQDFKLVVFTNLKIMLSALCTSTAMRSRIHSTSEYLSVMRGLFVLKAYSTQVTHSMRAGEGGRPRY